MFVPPFSPRRSSHLAGSPSPWRNPSSLIHRASSSNGSTERDFSNVPALVSSSNVSALVSSVRSVVSTNHRHPSLDGDSSLSDEGSLEGKASGQKSLQSGADSASGISAGEGQGSSGAQGGAGYGSAGDGAQGGAGNGGAGRGGLVLAPSRVNVDVGRGAATAGSEDRGIARAELIVNGAEESGAAVNVRGARGVLDGAGDGGERDPPPYLLPRQVQSERHLPDIVPRLVNG